MWAIKYNITQKSLTALLCILQKERHNDLPSDARTLLGTPKNTIIRECGAGHYFYYGLLLKVPKASYGLYLVKFIIFMSRNPF